MKYLQDGVAEAGTWTRASFGGHQDLLVAVGLYRRTLATAKAKIGFMDVVPWLLARLDHRHLLLIAMPSRGSSSCLEWICGGRSTTWLEATYLNDSVGEGLHTAATRIGADSRPSTLGWIASTMRQNLIEFVSLTDKAYLSRQRLWSKLSCRVASNLASVASENIVAVEPSSRNRSTSWAMSVRLWSQMLLGCCVSRRDKGIFQWSSDKTRSSCGCAIGN